MRDICVDLVPLEDLSVSGGDEVEDPGGDLARALYSYGAGQAMRRSFRFAFLVLTLFPVYGCNSVDPSPMDRFAYPFFAREL